MKIAKQQGIGIIRLLFFSFILILSVVFAVKTIPSYLADMTVTSVLKHLAKDIQEHKIRQQDIRQVLLRRLARNNIKSVKKTDITIKKHNGKLMIVIDYEVKKPLIGNISIVLDFRQEQEVSV